MHGSRGRGGLPVHQRRDEVSTGTAPAHQCRSAGGGPMESRAKLAGHAIHPMLITLPLGLLGTAVVFDIIRAFTDEADLAVASFYMLACPPPAECSRSLLGESLCWVGHSAESGPRGEHGGLSEGGDVVASGM